MAIIFPTPGGDRLYKTVDGGFPSAAEAKAADKRDEKVRQAVLQVQAMLGGQQINNARHPIKTWRKIGKIVYQIEDLFNGEEQPLVWTAMELHGDIIGLYKHPLPKFPTPEPEYSQFAVSSALAKLSPKLQVPTWDFWQYWYGYFGQVSDDRLLKCVLKSLEGRQPSSDESRELIKHYKKAFGKIFTQNIEINDLQSKANGIVSYTFRTPAPKNFRRMIYDLAESPEEAFFLLGLGCLKEGRAHSHRKFSAEDIVRLGRGDFKKHNKMICRLVADKKKTNKLRRAPSIAAAIATFSRDPIRGVEFWSAVRDGGLPSTDPRMVLRTFIDAYQVTGRDGDSMQSRMEELYATCICHWNSWVQGSPVLSQDKILELSRRHRPVVADVKPAQKTTQPSHKAPTPDLCKV